MIALGARWADGVRDAIERHGLPGTSSGSAAAPSTGSPDAAATAASSSERRPRARAFHASYALNRGILLTPFHNMALMSPATTEDDVDAHTKVFDEMADELTA